MKDDVIALFVERIKRALENEGLYVEEDKIREEFQKYIDYDIGPEEAEIRILRKHGIKRPVPVEKKIGDISIEDNVVSLKGKIISINSVFINSKNEEDDKEKKKRFYGIIGDETGTIPFSAWDVDKLSEYSKGDSIYLGRVYVREWNGTPQLRISKNTIIERIDEEITTKISQAPSEEVMLGDISDGDRVSIKARILSIEEREINIRGNRRTIYSGIMADESAKVPFTAWKDFEIKPGDLIKVEGAYVRSWKGVPQINLDDGMVVEKIVEEEFPSIQELDREKMLKIEELERKGGMTDVVLEGTVVQIKSGSGLIFRCPRCRRVLNDGICTVHGEVEGMPDLRIKAVIDDGTGTINVIAGREITERILKKDINQCLEEAKKKMEKGIVAKEIFDILALMPVKVRGNIISDDLGYTFIATDMVIIEEDSREKAMELMEKWGI